MIRRVFALIFMSLSSLISWHAAAEKASSHMKVSAIVLDEKGALDSDHPAVLDKARRDILRHNIQLTGPLYKDGDWVRGIGSIQGERRKIAWNIHTEKLVLE